MKNQIQISTVEEVINMKNYEGMITGVPTGMYADRSSYGNVPILVLILDGKLPCKFRAIPYSHRLKITKREESPLESLAKKTFVIETDNENEMLGIAAAFVDQSIKAGDNVEIHGKYGNGIFEGQYLKIGNVGFGFPGYKLPFEDEKD